MNTLYNINTVGANLCGYPNINNNFNNRNTIITNNQIHTKSINQNKTMNVIHTLAIAAGLFGCVALGNAQAQTNQKPISTETLLILDALNKNHEEIKELRAEMKDMRAEMKDIRAEMKDIRAEMQANKEELIAEMQANKEETNKRFDTIEKKVDRIGFYFDMLQYVFLTIVG